MLDSLTSISGLRIVNIVNNSVTIEIQDVHHDKDCSSDDDTAEKRPSMLLTLQFAMVDNQVVVVDIQVGIQNMYSNSFMFDQGLLIFGIFYKNMNRCT